MNKEKHLKELRLNTEALSFRADEQDDAKMIVEGYPIIFNKEAYIESWMGGFYEKVDPAAFERADMADVALKYNHNDDFLIMARTRNGSLKLTPDEKGVFMHAELIDTTTNRDVYNMVKAGLLTEGSFAFTVGEDREEVIHGEIHRTILAIDKLFDVAICPNGAYGDLTEIYARSYEALESVKTSKREALKRVEILKLKNANLIKLF